MESKVVRIYKENQFLVFVFDDDKTVKYDFAKQEAIGKNGKYVKNINTQLRKVDLNELADCFEDKGYYKFLLWIKKNQGYGVTNIGTILSRACYYGKLEQYFSAQCPIGEYNTIELPPFSECPKGLIKLAKKYDKPITGSFYRAYKRNPDLFNGLLKREYQSLTPKEIIECLTDYSSRWNPDTCTYTPSYDIDTLVNNHKYTYKGVIDYIDYLKTYEAIDASHALRELRDYARMASEISGKFEKYPRNFLTTHRITTRNYERIQKEYNEAKFKETVRPEMETTIGKYIIKCPRETQDIKDEAVNMHNCVSSYIDRVIAKQCNILFMRKKSHPEESWVTLEVRHDKIVQALRKYNQPLNRDEKEAVNKWNKWWQSQDDSLKQDYLA